MNSPRHKNGLHRTPARTSCTAAEVTNICRKAGFELTDEQAAGLTLFLQLLMQWNRAMNLVGAHSWQEALETLVFDSLWLARFLEQIWPAPRDGEIWDLGAGAGLPGIPLRVIWPRGSYCMVEAREKRALFLSTVLARLPLARTSVFKGRVEAFMPDRQADIILSRAFMPWHDVLRLTEGHLAPGGNVILLTREPVAAPGGWAPAGTFAYETVAGTRYFCAFTGLPTSAPS